MIDTGRTMLCPDCPAARTAREIVLADGFAEHALVAAIPFAAVFAIVYLIHRGLGPRRRRP